MIGEAKPPNDYKAARDDTGEYLDRLSIGADYGIATDGIRWGLYHMSLGGDSPQLTERSVVDLRPALLAAGKRAEVIPEETPEAEKEKAALSAFVELFRPGSLVPMLTSAYCRARVQAGAAHL